MKRPYTILWIVFGAVGLVSIAGVLGRAAQAQSPSFSCDKGQAGSIEEMICTDSALSSLDRKLADVYAKASRKAVNEQTPVLQAEQRGWIKGRDECWKSDDRRGCVEGEYKRRIAELQARYRLVPGIGPVTFVCGGDPRNEVTTTFFQTDPATLIAERGDSVSLMYVQPSGSGARYQGRNESFWEHQGEALVTWGHGAPEMRCKKAP
ncbi:MliC family protein [Microvirga sp. VF16]|uniref:MliC family protein n=1 Tax=Microvirga sp. VF16 TaxID=2807101 RepID=UPI00193D97EE|nr:MliC family protein [Microvirga sp. VF16]QRM30691.1 MliC family protein [Microvirga sp. VF16]